MDGDVVPVEALVDLSEQYDALLYLDEAHASGVFGRHGRGVAEEKNVEQRIPVRVGTFSKAFGSIGGFVVGSQACLSVDCESCAPLYLFHGPSARVLCGFNCCD